MELILRTIKHLLILIGIIIPLELLGIVVLLPVIASIARGRTPLPKLLKWFDNADQYLGRDVTTYYGVCDKGIIQKYIWIGLRNPLNYFGYSILGIHPQHEVKTVINKAEYFNAPTPNLGFNVSDQGYSGFANREYRIDLKTYYEYYLVYRYKRFPNKCLRFRLGWKLGNPPEVEIGSWIQWVFSFTPWKDYTGPA